MADADEDFDLDDDDIPTGESGVPAPTDYGDDDDFDDFDDDFDEDGSGNFLSGLLEDKKKLAMVAAGAVVSLGLIGGGAWWFFSDDTLVDEAEKQGNAGSAVRMALDQQPAGGLTPQGGAKLTAGAASKLTAAPAGGKLSAGSAAMMAAGSVGQAQPAPATPQGMGGYDPQNKKTPLSTAAVAELGVVIPAVLPQAVTDLGPAKQPQPLAPPNDMGLFEKTDIGMLPAVSPQGKQPWQTYSRPFNADQAVPKVGLVVTGLGMSQTLTEAAINHLPSDVTLSFSAYGSGVKNWVEKARAMGHEVLLELPMESDSFPADDPGPLAMMTSKSPSKNLKLLNLIMAQAQGYVGFVAQYGSKFTKNKKALAPVLGEMKQRGLFFMDPKTAEGSIAIQMADQMQLARAMADNIIDTNTNTSQIRAQLDTIATLAGTKGAAAALVHATPNSIKTIRDWAKNTQNAKLAPITNLAGKQ